MEATSSWTQLFGPCDVRNKRSVTTYLSDQVAQKLRQWLAENAANARAGVIDPSGCTEFLQKSRYTAENGTMYIGKLNAVLMPPARAFDFGEGTYCARLVVEDLQIHMPQDRLPTVGEAPDEEALDERDAPDEHEAPDEREVLDERDGLL